MQNLLVVSDRAADIAGMESIYNLIPQPVPIPVKEPIYRSKHQGNVPPTYSTFGITGTSKPGYTNLSGAPQMQAEGHHEYKKGFATMGKDGNAVPPSDMLKKRSGGGGGPRADVQDHGSSGEPSLILTYRHQIPQQPAVSSQLSYPPIPSLLDQAHVRQHSLRQPLDLCSANISLTIPAPLHYAGTFKYAESKKGAVPTAAELKASQSNQKKSETKNFITANAVENILAVPKRQPEAQDWLKKPHFGTVPPYLQKIKKEISDEYDYIRSMQEAHDSSAPEGMRLLPEDERAQLIEDLKAKWDAVNSTYQQSSVLSLASLDTIGKVKRYAPPFIVPLWGDCARFRVPGPRMHA